MDKRDIKYFVLGEMAEEFKNLSNNEWFSVSFQRLCEYVWNVTDGSGSRDFPGSLLICGFHVESFRRSIAKGSAIGYVGKKGV